MKTVPELLSYIRQLGIDLWVDGNSLRYSAPKEVMTPILSAQLAERKNEIITFLNGFKSAYTSTFLPLQPIARDGKIPLSSAQQRLWFLEQLEGDGVPYNELGALNIDGRLNIVALEATLNEIVRRHEVLRTIFPSVNGSPVCKIFPFLKIDLPIVDLQTFSEVEQFTKVQQLAAELVQHPFDLANDPLLRFRLLRLGERSHVLILVMHHIVFDGRSINVFFNELAVLYEAFRNNQISPLPDLPVQYADFAAWQHQWLTGKFLEKQLNYWKQKLANAPALLKLPTDQPRPAVQTFRGAHHNFALPKKLSEALVALSKRKEVTLFTTLITAFQILLYRYSGQEDILVGTPIANLDITDIEGLIGFFANTIVVRTKITNNISFERLLEQVHETLLEAQAHRDAPLEHIIEALQPQRSLSYTPLFQVLFIFQDTPITEINLKDLTFRPLAVESGISKFDISILLNNTAQGLTGWWEYNADLFNVTTIERIANNFETLLKSIVTDSHQLVTHLPLLSETEQQWLLVEQNRTHVSLLQEKYIHQKFEETVKRSPENIAVIFQEQQLTYQELNKRANQLAHYLQKLGVGADVLVGICIERSVEMVIGLLAILKAGGAYVPLDPAYPKNRLAFMISNSQLSVLLTQQKLVAELPENKAHLVCLDTNWETISLETEENPCSNLMPENLAYVIYTSGSTGQPKGVMVEHGQVVNFFTGMDFRIGSDSPGTWLAVTTISFDISVLELLWTLTRGFRVVVQAEYDFSFSSIEQYPETANKTMEFSLFYFASDGENELSQDKYKLLIEGAKFADKHSFSAIWTPERHFHAFGGLFPNSAVTSAAIAAVTEHIQIRAGSVVLPLHNPIRIAEEWAVVDNLSNGRVGISFATGWHANDFVLAPENYTHRKQILLHGLETVRQLWRGELVELQDGNAKNIKITTFPRPIQRELPIWITAAFNSDTFRLAGEIGVNVLTHLLGQSIEQLAEKIAIYRDAWQKHGHDPKGGHVTLMIHTFIGEDKEFVREKVRQPFCNYLRSSIDLVKNLAKSLNLDIDSEEFTEEDMETLLTHGFERYFESSGLFGTPETCLDLIQQLKRIGVNEVGCLIDFGLDFDSVISGLHYIDKLKELSNRKQEIDKQNYSLPALIFRHNVTHLQCTPSLIRMLILNSGTLKPLQSLKKLMLGGEALSVELANHLNQVISGQVLNMYGPTEATVWSTTYTVGLSEKSIPIGKSIANVSTYVLDKYYQPVPIGVFGELFIGGLGVARGYLNKPELTAQKFIPDQFSKDPKARMYKTGDLVRYLPDGNIEFVGRIDQQVKIRGFRIELGEIETILEQHPSVRDAVVLAREDSSEDKQLVAYFVPKPISDSLGDSNGKELLKRQISQWYLLWNQTYESAATNQDTNLKFAGWNSSYTGQPIPIQEMHEWVDVTVRRILSLKPNRVLEIGCGYGLLLLQIAPYCTQYWGTDFSEAAINYIQQQLSIQFSSLSQIKLFQRRADNFDKIETEQFDTIIINSVVQYFPSIDYLIEVLESAIKVIKPGGFIFVGDVRSLTLLQAFHLSVELYKASDSSLTSELLSQVQKNMLQEQELVIDPEFFFAFKQKNRNITHIQIEPKRGNYNNEMSKFRYDVILHVGTENIDSSSDFIWLDWQNQNLTLDSVSEIIKSTQPKIFGLRRVTNSRLQAEVKALELLSNDQVPKMVGDFRPMLKDVVEKIQEFGVLPEELSNLGNRFSYSIDISWLNNYQDGSYDVVFKHIQCEDKRDNCCYFLQEKKELKPWKDYTNNPLRKQEISHLIPDLRDYLNSHLPEYMVPTVLMTLEEMPLTPSGKIDRDTLAKLDIKRSDLINEYIPPRNTLELQLVKIWEEVLNINSIGIRDNFFSLGGHSLLAVRLIALIQKQFGKNLPLATFFQGPTVENLANIIQLQINSFTSSNLVAIQSSGNRIPFFCVHPIAGNVLCYGELAQHLGNEQPFYGLQSIGLNEDQEPLTEIENMADQYIQEIQKIQSQGPYQLGGWSFGGLVAFEMAQRLQKQGQQISLLVLMDTKYPVLKSDKQDNDETTYLNQFIMHIEGIYGKKLLIQHNIFQKLELNEKLNYLWKKVKNIEIYSSITTERDFHQIFNIFKSNSLAEQSYIPQIYPGKITFFQAKERDLRIEKDLSLNWRKLAVKGMDTYEVSGNHFTLLKKPYVQIIAQLLREFLNKESI